MRMSVWLLIWLAFVTINKGRSTLEGAPHVTCYTQTSGGSLKCLNIGGSYEPCKLNGSVYMHLPDKSVHMSNQSLWPLCMHECSVVFNSWWPTDCSPLDSSPMGFPKQESWSGLPFPSPGDLSDPGVEPTSLASPALALCYLGNPLKVLMSVSA